jgi:hypothetical protein
MLVCVFSAYFLFSHTVTPATIKAKAYQVKAYTKWLL